MPVNLSLPKKTPKLRKENGIGKQKRKKKLENNNEGLSVGKEDILLHVFCILHNLAQGQL